jgi:small subunit ribosomal protein S15
MGQSPLALTATVEESSSSSVAFLSGRETRSRIFEFYTGLHVIVPTNSRHGPPRFPSSHYFVSSLLCPLLPSSCGISTFSLRSCFERVRELVCLYDKARALQQNSSYPSARTGIASRATASTSSLHTSATLLAVSKLGKRSTPATKKRFEQEKRVEVATERAANAPHVVLGTRPGEEWKWNECDLAKCIVNEEQIRAATEVIPGHGVFPGSADERLLFTTLPALTAETKETWQDSFVHHNSLDKKEQAFMRNLGAEGIKAEQLAKLLDLRNANAKGIAFENRRRCVHEFSTPVKPNDPGRIEVQGMFPAELPNSSS